MTTVKQLLQQLPDLSDEQLKQTYFNRKQGTKVLVQMLPLMAQESLVLRVVKLALEVDLKLGAKLARAVQPQFQLQAVGLIAGLQIPQPLKNRLLGMTGSDSAIPELLQSLSIHRDARCRRSAARALVQIGSDTAVALLLRSLASRFDDIQGWAAWSLSQIGSETAVRELRQALDSSQSSVRYWAVWALGEINSDAAFVGLLKAFYHPDFEVRWRAVAGLGKSGRKEIVPKLLEALEDESNEVRYKAASTLGKIGDNLAANELVKALKDEDKYVCSKATDALAKIGGKTAESGLMQALKHSDRYVRGRALSALRMMGGSAALTGIIEGLEDEDYIVRAKAADELGWLGNNGAIAGLLKALDDPEHYVRWRVAAALGQLGGEEAVPGLVSALEDENSMVRQRATKSLGDIGSLVAISALHQAASHKYANVRAWASVALQKIDEEAATDIDSSVPTEAHLQNLPKLSIVSQAEASERLRSPRTGQRIKAIVSIGSPGTSPPRGFSRVPNRLRLEFDDIEEPADDPESKLPAFEDIRKAIAFAPSVAGDEGTLLVHCQAGISRSSAVALTICAAILGPGKEEEAMAYIMEARPIATPNLWIVELADEALGRDGRLVDAAQFYQDLVSPGHVF